LAPHESELITALIAEIRGYRDDVTVLHTKLFGDARSENPEGRIPRLEASIKNHRAQLTTLGTAQARRNWTAHLLSGVAGAILSLAALIYYIHNIARN
jgi:hypothetical protein